MERKNVILISVVLVAVIFGFWYFNRTESIKNYPSSGTDIIAFGDSLVQGVGASSSDTNFVSLLSKRIGQPIVNLGISGNTTQDGLDRLVELDKYDPKIVLLLLGGNDHLKKVPIDITFNNLSKIIENIQARGAIVILLGVRGNLIGDKFEPRFEDLADEYDTAYVSDVLDGLFGNMQYMSDAIHPNDIGYSKIAERVAPVLKRLLK